MRQWIVMFKFIDLKNTWYHVERSFHLDISITKKDNTVCFERICWNLQWQYIIKKICSDIWIALLRIINILYYSFRLQLAISWKKKKTMKTFSYTTHSELMRKKMVTKYSHIIPRTKIIRIRERESKENERCWSLWRVRCRDMYNI